MNSPCTYIVFCGGFKECLQRMPAASEVDTLAGTSEEDTYTSHNIESSRASDGFRPRLHNVFYCPKEVLSLWAFRTLLHLYTPTSAKTCNLGDKDIFRTFRSSCYVSSCAREHEDTLKGVWSLVVCDGNKSKTKILTLPVLTDLDRRRSCREVDRHALDAGNLAQRPLHRLPAVLHAHHPFDRHTNERRRLLERWRCTARPRLARPGVAHRSRGCRCFCAKRGRILPRLGAAGGKIFASTARRARRPFSSRRQVYHLHRLRSSNGFRQRSRCTAARSRRADATARGFRLARIAHNDSTNRRPGGRAG